jgi:hypothetical protein
MTQEEQVIEWDEIRPLISQFEVWAESPERSWFKKAWHGLHVSGLTKYSNDEDRHWVLIRAIALGVMYGGFCQLEWDQHCDAESCISEIYSSDDISHTRIGNMQERHFEAGTSDDQDLFCSALLDLVSQVKLPVYDAISKEFGGAAMLYAGLYVSREEGNDQENLANITNEIFDSSHSPVGRDEAFGYVCASMFGVDA